MPMMKRLLTILCIPAVLLLNSTEGWSLPPCEGRYNPTWINYFGTITYPSGVKHPGEFRGGERHGQGTDTLPDGSVLHKGAFRYGKTIY